MKTPLALLSAGARFWTGDGGFEYVEDLGDGRVGASALASSNPNGYYFSKREWVDLEEPREWFVVAAPGPLPKRGDSVYHGDGEFEVVKVEGRTVWGRRLGGGQLGHGD